MPSRNSDGNVETSKRQNVESQRIGREAGGAL
jgi:hypothetical protein